LELPFVNRELSWPDKPVKRSSVIDRFTEKLKTFLESAE
jgi:hypothetical protein